MINLKSLLIIIGFSIVLIACNSNTTNKLNEENADNLAIENQEIESHEEINEYVAEEVDENYYVVLEKGTTIGTFNSVDWGDYCYLSIMDPDKNIQSFMFFKAFNRSIDVDKLENPKLQGKNIEVKWQKVEAYIEECACKNTFIELVDIKFLN